MSAGASWPLLALLGALMLAVYAIGFHGMLEVHLGAREHPGAGSAMPMVLGLLVLTLATLGGIAAVAIAWLPPH